MMTRQPTLYLTHGGGPCFWVDFPEPFGPRAYIGLKQYFAQILSTLPMRPRAILIVSAHWEEPVPTVSIAANPSMFFDYSGFPLHAYQLNYPASGAPRLAKQVKTLLDDAGFTPATNYERGYDHGVFVPMLIIDPQASIPVVMLSMEQSLDPARHFAIGAALAPLRDDNVLIIGSGSSFHNLNVIFDVSDYHSKVFDDWLNATLCQLEPQERSERLLGWTMAPGALNSHPRADHLIPLMVTAGAAGVDSGYCDFNEVIGGKTYSCFSFWQ